MVTMRLMSATGQEGTVEPAKCSTESGRSHTTYLR